MTTAINMTIYQCEKCKETFDTLEEAQKCENSHFDISHFHIVSCSKADDLNVEKLAAFKGYIWPNQFYISSKMYGMTGIYRFERFEMVYDKDRK